MRVLICHERFIGRFGADRVFLILARRLRQMGAHVTLMGGRFDDELAAEAADARIETPLDRPAQELEDRTVEWLSQKWAPQLAPWEVPDLIVVGGWPFFSAIPIFRAVSPRVLFIDCGVVPLEGFGGEQLKVLQQLRELRTRFLRYCTHISPISRFLLRTQSLPQAGPQTRCAPVLLGVDHLDDVRTTAPLPERVAELVAEGRRLILLLGRFEAQGYKNSPAGFTFLDQLRCLEADSTLLVLEKENRLPIPSHLKPHVVGLGHPDDAGLVAVMRHVHLGVSVSKWEGFNLPFAEMFWLGKPALAFDVAAHPEVAIDPWFLARDMPDMVARAAWILQNGRMVPTLDDERVAAYRQRFTWQGFVDETVRLAGIDPRVLPAFSR
jgi:glycosyltransferase involved in cell wall biosynthesis